MFIVGILSWWYGAGWKQRAHALVQRISGTADYFSIDLLLKTLFSPYRQISAEKVNGSLNVQMRAFFDRLLSRIIGAIIRTFMIMAGIVGILLYSVIGALLLLAWGVIPLLPAFGLALFILGWIPWKV